ncbi:hypothetical protein DSCA_06030 [Desulfosarcina alkanivorans]|uniref:Uncharacterized protein n=1 Tax=Desulfosarcina alkanivorans TaxID=571177 RepID=A0A5K7YDF7_9BACT|nr:hypothetical protein [Desulfosarcina alkanivorans]BBO66673.1 hypothetical protein DSCA_06030 [Desulfosarcina alkanivorans]
MKNETVEPRSPEPKRILRGSRLWFSKEAERRFYFILTMIMLVIGILYKTGIW